jgi:DNA-binding GntR family transcriptional regulator
MEEGVFRPGDRLREQDLADRFGVSRGPVREALRILEAKAVVNIEPMRGATLTRLSDADAIDAIEASAVIFGLVAQRAAERQTVEGIAYSRAALNRLEQLQQESATPRKFFGQTVKVGLAICDICGSERLKRLTRDVRFGAPDYFGPLGYTTPQRWAEAVADWRALIDSVEAGDGFAARDIAVGIHHKALRAALEIAA